MRKLYCPICADEIEWRINEFRCSTGSRFSAKLGNAIKNAVYGVEPAISAPRKPLLAPYLWCPNCTAELEEYNDKQRRLRCAVCSLELSALEHFELMDIKDWHDEPYVDDVE